MTTHRPPVVAGIDSALGAVRHAAERAARDSAPLRLVHAYEFPLGAPTGVTERLAGWPEKYPDVHVEREVVHDRPTRAPRRCARTARLMAVGRHGRTGLADLALGSTSSHLLHHAPCPVAVVRPEPTE